MSREPTVLTKDIQRVLRQVVRPDSPDGGEAVARVAERARTSTRTVYRTLNPPPPKNGVPHTIPLDLADRLVLACDRQLAEIGARVLVGDALVDYLDA